jgi:xanthine dehydrogenase accessory factor
MDILDCMVALKNKGQPFVEATVVRIERPTSSKPGAKAIITPDGALSGWIGGSCAEPSVRKEALKALSDGQPRLLRLCPPEKMNTQPQDGVTELKITCMSGGTLEIYLEPHLVQPQLVVIGHQAIAEALVVLGKALEYGVTVIGENLSPERFPLADRVIEGLDFSQVRWGPNTYAIIASHGNYDELALEAVLTSPAAYVALVTSKKRAESIRAYLRQDGMSEETLARLKSPAGLDFGARTPSEIALSILAEIIQVHRRGANAAPISESLPAEEAAPSADEALDPVCGMTVEIGKAHYTASYQGKTFYFCSVGCQRDFIANPEKYLQPQP